MERYESIDDVIDGHCHVGSTRFIPSAFFEGVANNINAKINAYHPGTPTNKTLALIEARNQDHDADLLVSEMNNSGISMAVLLLPDFTYVMKHSLTIEEMVKEHIRIQKRHENRFAVLAGIDPRWGKDGINLFEKCITEYKFSGLKLYPPCGYSLSDRMLYPFYEICQANKAPVLYHCGPTSPALSFGNSFPMDVDQPALDFPSVNFIIAHGGVNYVEGCVYMAKYRPNVYLDLGAFPEAMHPGGWKKNLEEVFSMGVNHKIIFGTDWPLNQITGGQRELLNQLISSEDAPLRILKKKDRNLVMHGTIKRLLGLN